MSGAVILAVVIVTFLGAAAVTFPPRAARHRAELAQWDEILSIVAGMLVALVPGLFK